VARLAGVPVATLRVWERRYAVVDAPKSAHGQRLYSAHDVQRLRLLRQLTERGHAIGTLAALGLQPLQALWAEAGGAASSAEVPAGPRQVVVVGRHAANKLAAAPGCELLAVFDDLSAAASASLPNPAGDGSAHCDVLLLHVPSLQPLLAEQAVALSARWRAKATVVLYGFGAEPVAEGLRATGALVRRDPISATELARLVAEVAPVPVPVPVPTPPSSATPPARSFSDDDLMTLADMPSNVACECPRHLAEILLQLGAFERYSTDCQSRGPADAALHLHLSQLAGTARSLFEQALQRVMVDEGLVLNRAA
jgi:hypothetical protein